MSDNKKYYYLKLKDDFFDTDEMIVLESMPDGWKYSNILMKLYLRSLKNEGKLMFNNTIPFNSQMLSSVTRHSVGDIEKAVQIFKELNLIEVLDNGAIFLTDIQNYIGRSTTEADRKREYRNRIEQEKLLLIEERQMSDKCPDKTPPEKEIEKEIEIEIEKEIEIEIEKDKPSKQVLIESDFKEIWKLYPKKTMRKEALAAYKRAIKNKVGNDDILQGIKNYNQHLENNKDWLKPMDGGRWFQKERWNDEYDIKNNNSDNFENIDSEWVR